MRSTVVFNIPIALFYLLMQNVQIYSMPGSGHEAPVSSHELLFKIFVRKYHRPYKFGSKEYFNRFQIFQQSLKRHKYLNSARIRDPSSNQLSAVYGITQFSDLTQGEFRDLMLSYGRNRSPTRPFELSETPRFLEDFELFDVPETFDWAFSVVETVESMNYIKHKQLTELSVQQVINCAPGEGKCHGGDISKTVKWLTRKKVNITTEAAYPLTDTSGTCTIHPETGVQVESYNTMRFVGYETAMVTKIAQHGPLTITADAKLWQDYMGGIIQYHCGQHNDHAVQIVGYNNTGPVQYFVVRNSWGPDFGHQGYLYIEIGKNLCGLAQEVLSLDARFQRPENEI